MIVVTHPDNGKLLESINKDKSHWEYGIPPLNAIRIKFDQQIPVRDIEYTWEPPKDGRFCSYGPEDESWLRPLGISTLHPVDMGPLFLVMNQLSVRTDFMPNVVNLNGVISSS